MGLSPADTILALLAERADLNDHVALIDGDTRLTYRNLFDRAQDVGRAMIAAGIDHGDRIAIWLPNRWEFAVTLLGSQIVGAAVVPLNTRYTGHEAADILRRSRAKMVVLDDTFLGKGFTAQLRAAASEPGTQGDPIPGLPHLIRIVDVSAEANTASAGTATSFGEFLAARGAVDDDTFRARVGAVTRDDMVDMLFTSGTTGQPKGVISLQHQTLSVARTWAHGAELSQADIYGVVSPMFHSFGYKAGLIATLTAGATCIMIPVFEPEALMATIAKEKISVLPGVPTIFTTMMDHPRRGDYDLSSLRFAVAGATTAPPTLFADMVARLGFDRVAQAYGLTECVVATFSRLGESLEHASQTTGPAVPGLEIRVIDPLGHDVAVDAEGEILLRGDIVTPGYFEDAEATAAAFDADGFFHTGDAGSLDEHGCLKITDRIKDMFIVGGFNVYPAEIEHALRQHPAVTESAVIGVPDQRLGEVARAYVLLRESGTSNPSADDLREFCRSRLANFKVPREIILVDMLPRTATGKIVKSELRSAAR